MKNKILVYNYVQYLISFLFFTFICFYFRTNNLSDYFLCLMFYVPYFIIFRKNNNLKEIIIAILIWVISVKFIEPLNFKIEEASSQLCRLIVHVTYYTVLLYSVKFIFKVINNYNSVFYKRWVKITFIYFLINFVILLLIWPGNYVWDEKSIFWCAQRFIYSGWQSYLSVLLYSWSLLLIPYVVGIQVVQITIISLIVGYILSKIFDIYQSKKIIFVLLVLLSFPPILMNNMYPLRHAIYTYVELLLLSKIFFMKKEDAKIKINDLYIMSFCIIILSFWRTEGLYYLLLGPLAIIYIFKKYFNTELLLKMIFSLILFLVMYMPFNILNKKNPSNYVLTSVINPLSIMFQEKLNISETEYNRLNSVINIELLKKYPSYTECPSFWKGVVLPNYNIHMKSFIISYAKLVLKNPVSFLNARSKTFLATTGLDKNVVANSPWDMYENLNEINDYEIKNMVNNDKLSKPFNINFRNKVMKFFKGVQYNSYTYKWLGRIIWNFIPMLIIMVVLCIYYFIKKEYSYFYIIFLPLIKACLVFCTAPATYFFYYFSIYLIGILIIGIVIYNFFNNCYTHYTQKISKEI